MMLYGDNQGVDPAGQARRPGNIEWRSDQSSQRSNQGYPGGYDDYQWTSGLGKKVIKR